MLQVSQARTLPELCRGLKESKFDSFDLKLCGFEAPTLRLAGFDAATLKLGGYDYFTLKVAGFAAEELRDAGFVSEIEVCDALQERCFVCFRRLCELNFFVVAGCCRKADRGQARYLCRRGKR